MYEPVKMAVVSCREHEPAKKRLKLDVVDPMTSVPQTVGEFPRQLFFNLLLIFLPLPFLVPQTLGNPVCSWLRYCG